MAEHPFWFQKIKSQKVEEWIVQKFEVRIIKCFLSYNKEEIFPMMMIQKRDEYVRIWE